MEKLGEWFEFLEVALEDQHLVAEEEEEVKSKRTAFAGFQNTVDEWVQHARKSLCRARTFSTDVDSLRVLNLHLGTPPKLRLRGCASRL